MPRKIQTTYTRYPTKTLASIGDSLTFNPTYAVRSTQYYTCRAAVGLNALGCVVRDRDFGVSGQTSTQMAARAAVLTRFGTPTLGVVWAGHNDVSNGINAATTTANIKSLAETLFAGGASYVVVCSTHYWNFSTPDPWPISGARQTLWNAQNQAYTDELALHPGLVAWVDLYGFMHGILGTTYRGVTYASGDYKWHVADNDVHLNAAGEQIVADAIVAAVQAQSGWVAGLS